MAAAADVAVLGDGPAGLAAALALAAAGARVGLGVLAAGRGGPDHRTAALFPASIRMLDGLGVTRRLARTPAPLASIRVIDDTGRLLRAPEAFFRAEELGLEAFGYNVANADLVAALNGAVDASAEIERIRLETPVSIEPGRGEVVVRSAAGAPIAVPLVVGADGRASPSRQAAGIATRDWSYPQTAIVTTLRHGRPHENTSTELHRRAGPLTTVPLPGNASSIVWVESPEEAGRLLGLDDDAFARALEHQLGGILGLIDSVGPRAAFPLAGMTAVSFAGRRIALVGESAHVVPPIGAQGLNLGLRDGAGLAQIVADALAAGEDPGADPVLARFDRDRRGDVAARTAAVDLLNRSLISDFLPLALARGAGLHALGLLPPLRRRLMQAGLGRNADLPPLMRGGIAAPRA